MYFSSTTKKFLSWKWTWANMENKWTQRLVCIRAKLLQFCSTLCNPMDVALQALLSMGFSRQEYQSGLSSPSPGDLPDPGIKPAFLASLALAGGFFTTEPPGKPWARAAAAAAAKSLQLCLTLCDPIDGSPPGSSIPGKNTEPELGEY